MKESIEVELKDGELVEVPLPNFKRAWARYCASKRETFAGGRNGSVGTQGYKKRLQTIGLKINTYAFYVDPVSKAPAKTGLRVVVFAYARENAIKTAKAAGLAVTAATLPADADRGATALEQGLGQGDKAVWIRKQGGRKKEDYEKVL